jgi:hypothetical protein
MKMSSTKFSKLETFFEKTPGELLASDGPRRYAAFDPDLTNFDRMMTNHYAAILLVIPNPTINQVIPLQDWLRFTTGLLRVYLHLTLHPLYMAAGLETDSSAKILRLCLGEIPIPKVLIATMRELARPMVKESTIYFPYLDATFGNLSSQPPLQGMGLDIAQTHFVVSSIRTALGDNKSESMFGDVTALTAESLISAPMCVAYGAFNYVDRATATWRRKAWYLLRHFQNGRIIPEGLLKTLPGAGAVNAPVTWRPANAPFPDAPPQLQDTEPSPLIVAAPVAAQVAVIMAAIQANVNAVLPGGTRLYVIYATNAIQNDWLARMATAAPGVPLLESVLNVCDGLIEPARVLNFPSEMMRSKTPPGQGTVRADSKPKKDKQKQNRKKGGKKKTKNKTDESDSD